MNTTITTKPALAVVWPTDTFWPPNPKAAVVALGAIEFLQENPYAASTPAGTLAAAMIKAFLMLTCECAPEPQPKGPDNVS